jgi:hypothetical protein
MRWGLVALCALLLAPATSAAPNPVTGEPRLTKKQATDVFLSQDKVADWLDRYPRRGRVTEASYRKEFRSWTVKVWWGKAGEIATGKVDDTTGAVTEAWTGPQVAWQMARGGPGTFGGETINRPLVWLGFCGLFLLGLADWRRPWSVRNLDLLVLLSFSVSLWFFNRGDIFVSVPAAYPPLLYLLGRAVWIGIRGSRTASRPLWPVWVLAAATVFLAGFRVGLNVQASNVIDVGYAGVIGAHRLADGQAPYGHFPIEDDLKPCGPADAEGVIRDRIQTNGRCEHANETGDTYGPVSYVAYLPGYLAFGWTGKWDDLPAAHFTTIAFDLLCIVGLALAGYRFGGAHLAATLGFAWAAYPFTQYASSSNTNDMILPAFLILGFWLLPSSWGRGALLALSGWTKFAALIVAPLWLSYGGWRRRWRPQLGFAGGFLVATALAFSVLLLEPDPLHAARVFYDRTIVSQVTRQSPFSPWDWGRYHARGIPDLHLVQLGLEVLLVAAALAAAFVPRTRSPLRLAALTGALLIGFEVVLTHWFYVYIPWFFPFLVFAFLAPARISVAVPPAADDRPARELAPVG